MENVENLLNLSFEAYAARNYEKAADYVGQAAEQGDREAIIFLAELMRDEKTYEKAMTLLLQLAEQGDTDAILHVAKLYEKENYIGYDREKAIEWYKKGAEAGDSRAICALAVMGRKDLQRMWPMRDRQRIWHW